MNLDMIKNDMIGLDIIKIDMIKTEKNALDLRN